MEEFRLKGNHFDTSLFFFLLRRRFFPNQDPGNLTPEINTVPVTLRQKHKKPDVKAKLAEEHFRSEMKDHGLRCTLERIAVLREIYESNSHLDADELFVKLKNKGVGISRATVYHTLDLLLKFHLVTRTDLGHKHTHYEKAYGVENHLHMVCNVCGRVLEISDSRLSSMLETLCRQNGFEPENFTLQLFGNCSCSQETSLPSKHS
jgi:Fur family ferric uptake transcriptional regulator